MTPRQQRSLPMSAWPEADRHAWQAVLSPVSSLLEATGAARLSRITTTDLQRRYACFLGYCLDRDLLAMNDGPAASVTEPVVRTYIEHLAPRVASVTMAGCVGKILRVSELIAPGRDWAWLRRFANRLEFHMQPRDKRPDVVDVRRVYRLGIELMNRADAGAYTPQCQARIYRDGLLIAMLAASALRLGTFVRLEIDKTFSFTGTSWSIHLPGTRGTKYKRPTEKPLPPMLTPFIDRWIAVYRRRFHGANDHQRLWPSRNGLLTAGHASRMVSHHTREAFGKRVNPHLFRDCAVTTICTEFSTQANLGSAVLDHIDRKTTQKHYNQAKMVDAVKAYQRRLELRD